MTFTEMQNEYMSKIYLASNEGTNKMIKLIYWRTRRKGFYSLYQNNFPIVKQKMVYAPLK